MPVDRNQPVYPPSKGEDILATWGDAVSEHVVQRFATPTDRDMRWSNPPRGAVCMMLDTLTICWYDGTKWVNPATGVPLQQTVRAAGVPSANGNSTNVPTVHPGTSGSRTYLPLATLSGDPIVELTSIPWQVKARFSGLFQISFGCWVVSGSPPFMRFRNSPTLGNVNGAVMHEGTAGGVFIGYVREGDYLGVEVDVGGVAVPPQIQDSQFVLLDLRRTAL